MVERWVGSTTRRRGAIGGEFLQQGFAYTQSGGRERGGQQGDWLEGKVYGVVRPQPSLYRGVGRQPYPLPQAKPAAPKEEEWGARKPPLLEGLSRV